MDAQDLAPESPLLSDKEQLNAPPGWTKKLVPTKVKGFTPKKYDAIFIAPDGQEVHSKWHLRRYLKAHPDGPAISEFIWSSGDETPVRRSARFATTRESKENEESTPKKQGKRNAAEIDEEVTGDGQAKTPPRKRAKKGDNSSGSVDKGAAQDVVEGTGKDEEMHDVQDKTTMLGDGVTQDETLNGGLHINEGSDKQASKATATEKRVVEAPSDEKQVEDVSLTPLEENTVSEVMEQSEPVVTESAADGVEQHEVELKVLAETDTSAILSGEVKDNKVSMEAQEPSGCIDCLKFVERKEQPDSGDEKDVFDPCLINSDKVTVETPVLQELLEGSDKIFEPLIQKEEEQERLLNCHNSPLRVEQGQEKKTLGESNYSPVPASVAN